MTLATQTPRSGLRLDPITFEILRHRLLAINEEAVTTVKLVSGSSIATASNDLNTTIMTATGEDVAVGCYSLAKASTMRRVVADILENYVENPGIRPGDAFLCNDAYLGVQHQNDVALVMPFFVGDRLVAWVGAEVHQIDVGGPVPGNVQIGAQDIYGEAPLIPPIKIVEGGVLRNDIERSYLRRSRTPDLLALDLRAKWAACNVATERLDEIVAQHGLETFLDLMNDILDYSETRFRARLAALPDGTWRHVTYLDFNGDIYRIQMAMTKTDDELLFDFRGTAAQAPAIINCTRESLVAVLFGYVCISLCWDIPWTTAGIGRAIDVVTDPATIVSCEWPAGVCKSTTSVSWSVGKAVGLLTGKMLACHDGMRNKAMASWQGAMIGEEVQGFDRHGRPFAAAIIDAMAGGGGARTFADGIDTGGYLGSMGMAVANVETYESESPILYLYRRQLTDGGGAGRFRGGASIAKAYITIGVEEIPNFVMHCVGAEMPLSPGNYGGYPSTTNQLCTKHGTDIRERLAAGQLPGSPDDLAGELEVHQNIARGRLLDDDVYFSSSMGGGGYGDPLSRDAELVARDVAELLVSETAARDVYGVILVNGRPDVSATAALRDEVKRRRLAEARPAKPAPQATSPLEEILRAGDDLRLLEADGRRFLGCACGRLLSPADENFKEWVAEWRRPLSAAGPECDPFGLGSARFELREYYCPGCAVLLATDALERDEPVVWELQLA